MKRRKRWPQTHQWRQWFTALGGRPRPEPQRPKPSRPPAPKPWHMPSRVVLRFRDGSSVMLDPGSPIAIEIHQIADRWLTGR